MSSTSIPVPDVDAHPDPTTIPEEPTDEAEAVDFIRWFYRTSAPYQWRTGSDLALQLREATALARFAGRGIDSDLNNGTTDDEHTWALAEACRTLTDAIEGTLEGLKVLEGFRVAIEILGSERANEIEKAAIAERVKRADS